METEWSFVISLKEPESSEQQPIGAEDDAAQFAALVEQVCFVFSFVFLSTKLIKMYLFCCKKLNVKPPSGIAEVRRYIEQVYIKNIVRKKNKFIFIFEQRLLMICL